jgi:putative thymidine phosphorylase
MRLIVKDMDIATGGVQVVLINQEDARMLDLHAEDRLLVRKGRRETTAVLDIGESPKAVPRGRVGVFEEVLDALHAKDGDVIEIELGEKPKSIACIKKKLDGFELSQAEVVQIVKDITDDKLTDIELTSYVTANYANGMSMKEIVFLTKAMVETGDRLVPKAKIVADLHCIGGVPGNRTTMIVVPILVAAGLTVPKTASRAITSPAGTADTMEVLAPVALPKKRLEQVLKDVGGFIVWGGAMNLAPADEKIIHVEHPLSIDAEGQMLASIMAKKAVVGATHLLVDLPVGPGSKLKNKSEALHLQRHFDDLGKVLGIKMKVIITNGSEPIGNGIGPALEARDCVWLLQGDARAPKDLLKKSLKMAGMLLEFTGKAAEGDGYAMANGILRSGEAYDAMVRMIKAQGGKEPVAEKIQLCKLTAVVKARRSGTVIKIDDALIARVARIAGAPQSKGAGLFLHVHKHADVKQGDLLMTIYSDSQAKLDFALKEAVNKEVLIIQ